MPQHPEMQLYLYSVFYGTTIISVTVLLVAVVKVAPLSENPNFWWKRSGKYRKGRRKKREREWKAFHVGEEMARGL